MNDLTPTIAPKSDQLNADDLIGGPRTITITRVERKLGDEQPVAVFFAGDNGKPWKPCKSMLRVMVRLWGADAARFAGRSLTLYNDPEVTWGGMKVGGIRISHMSDIDANATFALTVSQKARKPYTVQKLQRPAGSPSSPSERQQAPDRGDSPMTQAAARAHIAKAAAIGTAALESAWKSIGRPNREALRGELDAFKAVAAKAGTVSIDVDPDADDEEEDDFGPAVDDEELNALGLPELPEEAAAAGRHKAMAAKIIEELEHNEAEAVRGFRADALALMRREAPEDYARVMESMGEVG